MTFRDKVVIVTGASQGIGRAIAIDLAKSGSKVLVNYNSSEDMAEEVVTKIHSFSGIAQKYRADVSKASDVESMFNYTIDSFGKLDFLINNAGIRTKKMVENMNEEDWDLVIGTNLKGMFFCCKAAIKEMKKSKGGKIINMTSGRGVAGMPGSAHYAASKGGIIAFTRSLAGELIEYGINVNGIAPGAVDTAQWRIERPLEEIKNVRETNANLKTPLMKKVSDPEDVVGTVRFLLSEDSDPITGQIFFIKSPYR